MMSRRTLSSTWATLAGLVCVLTAAFHELAAQDATTVPLTDPVLSGVQLDTPVTPGGYRAAAHAGAPDRGQVIHADYEYACDSCGGAGCDACTLACGPSYGATGIWLRADYLMWWEKETVLPPLATTSVGSPAPEDIGVIGVPTTQILFGGAVDDNPLDGFRIELGSWLDPGYNVGIFARYFTAGDRNIRFSAGPNDFSFLARPFFNLAADGEDAILLTVPGEREGSIDINYDGDVDGWELLLRSCAHVGGNYRIDYVLGYRQLTLDERLRIDTESTVLPNSPVGIQGEVTTGRDEFATENEFHGFDFGITGHSRDGCWSLDFMAKVALGNMRQKLDINGFAVVEAPDEPPTRLVGALLSQETNIGRYEDDQFTWVPELNVNIGYAITPTVDFTVGYSLLYVTDVLHPGITIDRVVDPALIVDLEPLAGDRPQVIRDQRDYWLQGLNFGVTARF